ncbi:hypothetical protein Tco_1311749 [Tanacetum coccineum]
MITSQQSLDMEIMFKAISRYVTYNMFEVAFRSNTCYVQNLEGDDLLTGSQEFNLYTISIFELVASSPVCLMSKATSTKSWIWDRRLSHLNLVPLINLREEIRNCSGNGGRGRSIFGRGGGSLAICSMESKDGLGGGGLVVVGGRSSRVSKRAWGEVGGVENKSLMGSMLIAKGEECLDGRVGASAGEVKGCGVDFGVTKSLLVEILRESDGEELVVINGGAI